MTTKTDHRFRVLGRPFPNAPPYYRGVTRREPGWISHLGAEHKVNKIFLQAAHLQKKNVYEDFDFCSELVKTYREVGEDVYEIIQITYPDEEPIASQRFFGFDVACLNRISLITLFSLHSYDKEVSTQHKPDTESYYVDRLLSHLFLPFRNDLNEYGLFVDIARATLFVDIIKGMRVYAPNFIDDCAYEVMGVWMTLGVNEPI